MSFDIKWPNLRCLFCLKAKASKNDDDSDDGSYDSSFINDDSEGEDISNDDFSEEEWLPTPPEDDE